jgi:hypothetical protein
MPFIRIVGSMKYAHNIIRHRSNTAHSRLRGSLFGSDGNLMAIGKK